MTRLLSAEFKAVRRARSMEHAHSRRARGTRSLNLLAACGILRMGTRLLSRCDAQRDDVGFFSGAFRLVISSSGWPSRTRTNTTSTAPSFSDQRYHHAATQL